MGAARINRPPVSAILAHLVAESMLAHHLATLLTNNLPMYVHPLHFTPIHKPSVQSAHRGYAGPELARRLRLLSSYPHQPGSHTRTSVPPHSFHPVSALAVLPPG